ncbi:RNA polymerase sigma factor [uncultured Pseudodesulfovibrio sp.]|uniref:RNA polymerase sigma factor n=1 Tax=uncultured Pseudodesulfovibrio sp. TaxID=2035858 RepID=UPI0029C6D925|nr:RNA polymerase sigma factor [uncultured Pseudodesulfovibrio sp.]
MPGKQDDTFIISQVLDGDRNAFALLLERYEGHVSHLVAAHVPGQHVAEVAHDAFIRAYKSLAGYKPLKPFSNWLTTIALRSCHDFWRKRYRNRETPACDMSDDGQQWLENAMAPDSNEIFESQIRQREAREVLAMALEQISPMDRMVLTLTYLEERTIKEAAQMLDISVPNVKIRAYRAKRTLKAFLKRCGIQGGTHDA